MARNTLTYTVAHEGRDKGKVFVITELSAAQAEDWAMRAFLALARNGIEVPDNVADAGLAGIAAMGIKLIGQLKHEDAQPLMAEMMQCVKIMPNATNPSIVRGLLEDDIEEVKTRLELRKAIIELHTGFSFADAASKKSAAASASKASPSPSTSTSRATSPR